MIVESIETAPRQADPDLISVDEAARVLKISRATAYRLVKGGEVPAHRVGGQYRVDRDELIAWLRASPPSAS